MPRPTLVHPIRITIQAVDKASSAFDPDTRQPLRSVARTTVRIPAQVRVRALSEPEYHPAGVDEDIEGWLTVRVVDCERRSYTPRVGDRVTAIGHRSVEYFIRFIQDEGHYPDQNGASLVRLYYEDRRPSAAAPRMN